LTGIGAVTLDATNDGNVWYITDIDELFYYDGANHTKNSKKAKDVGVGSDNSIFIVSDEVYKDGFKVYRSNDTGATWNAVDIGGVRIAAKAYNYAVTRDTNNVVYLLT
jgi:methyl coenzyme M reductase beta subunit